MSASIIDLPDDLRPELFLNGVESGLTDRSLAVVNLCKRVCWQNDWGLVEEIGLEAEDLWRKHGEQTGYAVAFLWLADLYWRNGKLEGTLRHCEKAMAHVPSGPAPIFRVTKAVAHYLRGLAYQLSGSLSAAFNSYQEASLLFKASQGYWQRMGNNEQATVYEGILEWTNKLMEYVNHLRLDQAKVQMTLICPWRSTITANAKYVLAEVALTHPLTAQEVTSATSDFLSLRSRGWRQAGGNSQIGYKVGRNVQILGLDKTVKSFSLSTLNVNAQSDGIPVLPAGVTYCTIPVDDPLALSQRNINRGDYFLAYSTSTPAPNEPDQPVLLRHKGDDEIAVGSFERDEAGNVRQKILLPTRFVGEPETSFGPLGNVDFALHPT